ncbi:MAG: hypothetical protein AAF772_20605, partial [Acidobacteriota bacterium]
AETQRAASLLLDSPRLRAGEGFQLRLEGVDGALRATLIGLAGSVLARAQAEPRAGDEAGDLARRLAADFHEQAFAPSIDLSQADLSSLDGSPTAGGGRARERLDRALDTVVGGG